MKDVFVNLGTGLAIIVAGTCAKKVIKVFNERKANKKKEEQEIGKEYVDWVYGKFELV